MAERDLALDCRGGPWRRVPDVKHCPACLGSLPPNDLGACRTCGKGTPPAHPPVPLLIVDEEPKLIEEEMVETAGPASAKLTWWERFARWPNHG